MPDRLTPVVRPAASWRSIRIPRGIMAPVPAVLLSLLILLVPSRSGASPFRLLQSDASGVTLEYTAGAARFSERDTPFGRFESVDVPDHGHLAELGRPALPIAGAGIAVPEGTELRLSWEVLEESGRSGIRPLPAF